MAAGGKGHAPRPFSVSADEYASNWDAIFGRKTVGCSSTAEQAALTGSVVGSNPTAPANCTDCQAAVYIDPVTGA